MNEHLRKIYLKFLNRFGYWPNFPEELFFDQEEYGKWLEKCVEDNLDYTIELYGTDPTFGTEPDDGICIDW